MQFTYKYRKQKPHFNPELSLDSTHGNQVLVD